MRIKPIHQIQNEHREWSEKHFPMNCPSGRHSARGICEEAGELIHAYLKLEQKIRYTSEQVDNLIKDAIADICIYSLDVCNKRGYDFEVIVAEVWEKVRKRDWNSDRLSAHKIAEETNA